MDPLKGYKGKLLAEKIDNKDQFKCCVDLGFDYFQGFFLNKPDNLKGQAITENTSQVLRVLSELNKEDISLETLVELILQIPKLSYRILRISNSVYYYSGQKISSLIDAIFRLGVLKIISWTNLILLSSNPEVSLDLTERTLIRAKMCESIAKTTKYVNPQEAYIVGMFSTLDGMLNEPLPSLLSKIQLGDTLNQALLHYYGEIGKILECVVDYEQANFSALENAPFDQKKFTHFYLQGIEYANSILKVLS